MPSIPSLFCGKYWQRVSNIFISLSAVCWTKSDYVVMNNSEYRKRYLVPHETVEKGMKAWRREKGKRNHLIYVIASKERRQSLFLSSFPLSLPLSISCFFCVSARVTRVYVMLFSSHWPFPPTKLALFPTYLHFKYLRNSLNLPLQLPTSTQLLCLTVRSNWKKVRNIMFLTLYFTG